ncbi:MAG: FtsQ-type POTRA domain-containing protein [Syntrophomonadaceae bacterium]|nr:FtsQ-type POTRA domain-containing protein [Syntrophomonadaceae bacterium]MDD3888825.1 FtsQ-type POTRA domain-containing protein [Syntrophomonadaceae bacterium]MDD4548200.1 FtsQ-type POTRA domain-containing protein [Syntrophomonadaceae bacterium]
MSRKFFSYSMLIFIILVCSYLFLHSSFFNVDKLYVTGLEKVSREEITSLSGLCKGVNIFEINSNLCSRSIEIHPMIKSAKIVRHLPRKIEVQVVERNVWAVIPYHNSFLCVDEDGICIDKLSSFPAADCPVVITMDALPGRVNLGQAVQAAGVKMAKKVWDALSVKSRPQVSDIHFINKTEEIVIYTTNGTEVKFGSDERLADKATFVDQVIEIENDMDKKGIDVLQYVDLRFRGQPVVKTAP